MFIDVADIPDRMTIALERAARKVGANPIGNAPIARGAGAGEGHNGFTREADT